MRGGEMTVEKKANKIHQAVAILKIECSQMQNLKPKTWLDLQSQ